MCYFERTLMGYPKLNEMPWTEMEPNPPYDESTITGTSRNRAVRYRNNAYLISRFDPAGRKTDQIHTRTWGEVDEQIRTLCRGLDSIGVNSFDRVSAESSNRNTGT
jgi:hypothetical protein